MIGSGIFLLPASLAFYGGISIFGWVISATGALLLAFLFSSLSKKFAQSGGPYVYTRHGFGDFAGFLVAWGYWISTCTTNAAIAVAMTSYLTVFFPILSSVPLLSMTVGLSAIWFLTWINSRGVKTAGTVQTITTILKVTPLILIAIVGMFYMDMSHFTPFNISGKSNFTAIIETTTLTLFAFLGMECATIPSENVKNSSQTISRSTLIGTSIAIVIYVLGSVSVMGLLSPEVLQQSDAPFADAAMILWGTQAKNWVALGAVISTFGALNGWILIQGQMPMAAARDKMFPAIFGKLNSKGVPAIGIVISSIIISIIMSLNFHKGFVKAFEFMILLSTLTVLVPYLFSSITHILIASRSGKKGFWILGILCFIFSMWAVIGSGENVVFWGFVMLMSGLPLFIWTKIKQSEQENKL
jgi:APA family basic amino acid/polyamine antiporter